MIMNFSKITPELTSKGLRVKFDNFPECKPIPEALTMFFIVLW